eukprot:16430652-Heterocapsa_arctica.AAC.1
MHQTGKIPLQWHCSIGATIPKHNNEPRCASVRLIHILDDIGNAWAFSVWSSFPCTAPANNFVYLPLQRREAAVLVMRNALWRLAQNHTGSLACWYDMTNALASVIKTQLDS